MIRFNLGHRDVAEGLLISGAEVDPLGEDDITPLHIAAIQGNFEIV